MYIAKYNLGAQTLHQIVACLPSVVVSGSDRSWTLSYQTFVDLLLNSKVSFAYRIANDGSKIIRHFLITSPSSTVVTDLANTLDHLNESVEGSVQRPSSRTEHDQAAARFPPIRRNVARQQYFAAHFEIPSEFHVLAYAQRLLRFALSSQNDFGFQVNCCRFSISGEELRALRKRLTDLRIAGSIPDKLLAYLTKQIDDLPNRTHLIDEYVGAASNTTMNTAAGMLETAFNQLHAGLGLSGSPVEGPASDDEIESGLGSSFFDESRARRLWRSVAAGSVQHWLVSPPEKAYAEMGAKNVVKASLGVADLLAEITRRLDALDRRFSGNGADAVANLRGAIKIADINYLDAVVSARGIVEEIVRQVFAEVRPSEAKKGPLLNDMIERLQQIGAVPGPVYSSMHLVRKIGNEGTHRNVPLTRTDLEACMMSALRVVEWFLLERSTIRH